MTGLSSEGHKITVITVVSPTSTQHGPGLHLLVDHGSPTDIVPAMTVGTSVHPHTSPIFANMPLLDIAHRWFAAFNDHDLEALLSLYDEHAEHYSPKLKSRHPETNGLVSGKAALRSWWADAFERLPSLRYTVWNLVAGNDTVFMEYTRHVDGEDDLRVGEVLVVRDGLIVASRVYHG